MNLKRKAVVSLMGLTLAVAAGVAGAKQTVKIVFIGPLTGGRRSGGTPQERRPQGQIQL